MKKAISTLISKGVISRHPTSGGVTFSLTRAGLRAGNILRRELNL